VELQNSGPVKETKHISRISTEMCFANRIGSLLDKLWMTRKLTM